MKKNNVSRRIKTQNDTYAAGAPGMMYFLRVIFKRKKMLIGIPIVALGIGFALAFLLPPSYLAESELLVEKVGESEKAMLLGVNVPNYYDGVNWINSEIQIIKSYPVAQDVVKKLQLDTLNAEDGTKSDQEKSVQLQETIKRFREDLKIAKIGNSNILSLKFELRNPELAKKVLNETVDAYKKHRATIFKESSEFDFFSRQLEIAESQLRNLETKLTDFKKVENLIEPNSQRELFKQKLLDYQKSLSKIQAERLSRESRLKMMKKTSNASTIPAIKASDSPSRSEYLTKLKSELINLQINRDELAQKFSPGYPDLVSIDNKIKSTTEKLSREIADIIVQEQTSIAVLKTQEVDLQKSIEKLRLSISEVSEKDLEMVQLSRGIDDNRELYSVLLRQREEARLSLAKAQGGVQIRTISPPVAPVKPTWPRKKLTVAFVFLIGIFSAFSSAFLLEIIEEFRSRLHVSSEAQFETVNHATESAPVYQK